MAGADLALDILKISIFKELPDPQLRVLQAMCTPSTFEAGEFLIHEGVWSDNMFIVIDGQVEVLKTGVGSDDLFQIGIFSHGETLGERNLVKHTPAAASVRALCTSRVLAIPIESLRTQIEHDPEFHAVYKGLAFQFEERLRYANTVTVTSLESDLENAHVRIAMGSFLLTFIVLLSIYTYMLKFLSFMIEVAGNTIAATLPLIVMLLIAAWINLRIYKFPLSFYGLTTHNWRQAATEGLLFTLPLLFLSLLAKWLLITSVEAYHEVELFHLYRVWLSAGMRGLLFNILDGVYYLGLSVGVQEFIARGLQSCLQRFLVGRYRVLTAILASNLLFSVFHLFLSTPFALATFVLGVFWGWLYSRHGTLIGPIISHALLGIWALNIMGVQNIL